MHKGMGAAAVICDEAGNVLLVRHTYGRLNWELPGGLVESNESPSDAVLREVAEETGLTVEIQSLAAYYYEPAEDLVQFVFRCNADGSSPKPNSPEISECDFWPPDQPPRPISNFTVRRIQDALGTSELPMPQNVAPREWFE
jgi:8-oxo-dGTP diphosphatase